MENDLKEIKAKSFQEGYLFAKKRYLSKILNDLHALDNTFDKDMIQDMIAYWEGV